MAKEIKTDYKVIGIMAGSSMDGLDVAEVFLSKRGNEWKFRIGRCKTFEYDEKIYEMLSGSIDDPIELQNLTDRVFGEWIASRILDFDSEGCDLVAVHGHTLVHKPEEGISWQLGRGDIVSTITQLPVVSDFRSLDVKLGGQGAPLVPVGDFELFGEYDGCLNLGGIANISIRDRRLAWDICPCNQVLNYYAQMLGFEYDSGGRLAKKGQRNEPWIMQLGQVKFFHEPPPKSLPNGFLGKEILDMIEPGEGLHSYIEFMTNRIIKEISDYLPGGAQILLTGGGAFNSFLIELLRSKTSRLNFVVPDVEIIAFKEAIVFAFLGVLKLREEVNVCASVTGASRDSSSGVIHYPK